MKRQFLILSFFISLVSASAQTGVEIGYTVYSKARKANIEKLKSNRANAGYENILSDLDADKQTSAHLVINGRKSLFEEVKPEEELNDGQTKIVLVSMAYSDEESMVYKDLSAGTLVEVKDFLARTFIVEDSLKPYPWKLENGRKNIMGLECHKACLPDSTVAWYCPDLPLNDGPGKYWGLPGIILDIEDRDVIYRCVSVDTQSAEKIGKMKAGRRMSATEFVRFKAKTMEEYKRR